MIKRHIRSLIQSNQLESVSDALFELKHLMAKLDQSAKTKDAIDAFDSLSFSFFDHNHQLRKENKLRFNILNNIFCSLSIPQKEKLNRWILQRSSLHKPLQYILGNQPFLETDIKLRTGVLIPRWETEEWVDKVIQVIHAQTEHPTTLLDLCTGTACIPIAITNAIPSLTATAIDISPRALSLARLNTRRNNLSHRIHISHLDVLSSPLHAYPVTRVDYVTSNPPYIPEDEYLTLEQSVIGWEDKKALVGVGRDGAGFYRVIGRVAKELLVGRKGKRLFLEVGGDTQAGIVEGILREEGWNAAETWKDMAGKGRVVVGIL